jgi:hypothetical protein
MKSDMVPPIVSLPRNNIVAYLGCHATNKFTPFFDIATLFRSLVLHTLYKHLHLQCYNHCSQYSGETLDFLDGRSETFFFEGRSETDCLRRRMFLDSLLVQAGLFILGRCYATNPIVVTTETSVGNTMEQLLFPMQRSVLSFP